MVARAGGNPILIISDSRSRASHFILKQPITFCNRSMADLGAQVWFCTLLPGLSLAD